MVLLFQIDQPHSPSCLLLAHMGINTCLRLILTSVILTEIDGKCCTVKPQIGVQMDNNYPSSGAATTVMSV